MLIPALKAILYYDVGRILLLEVADVSRAIFNSITKALPEVHRDTRDTSAIYLAARLLFCLEVTVVFVYDILLLKVSDRRLIIGRTSR